MAAQRNKTDVTDARALAHIVRTGWFRPVHIKSEQSYRIRLLLTQRRNLKRKFLDIENSIRHSLKAFGIRLNTVSRGAFEAKVRRGAYFGLTPKRWQSGTSIDVHGRISKQGDGDARRALYEAASSMLTRFQGWSALKAWGMKIAKSRGLKKATSAVARKLAVIMHAMWRKGSEYRWGTSERAPGAKTGSRKLLCAPAWWGGAHAIALVSG